MRPVFDASKLPEGTPIEWAQAVNTAVVRLRSRKADVISYDEPTHMGFCCRWVAIFLQAHIRRGLSLLESGVQEIANNRPLVAALCARALLEDAALLWGFNRQMLPLLEANDLDAIDALIFPRVFASRLPDHIEQLGEEMRARNILTAIDKMTISHPNVRHVYDQLSDVCHPNSLGVFSHFADVFDKRAVFDDGQDMASVALHHMIFCGLMFAGEEPIMGQMLGTIDLILKPA